MDWSDDIAYSVHDLEDAVVAGHLDLDLLRDSGERDLLTTLTSDRVADAGTGEVEAALERLLALPFWPSSYDGTHRSLAALKNTTSQLIGRFCQAAERATHETFGAGPVRRYDADLVVPRDARLEVEVLKAVADRYVMSRDDATRRYVDQQAIVQELVAALLRTAPEGLEPLLRDDFASATDDAARLRVVIDQVAQLTDPSAVALHARLCGSGN
jgi:dGTPase